MLSVLRTIRLAEDIAEDRPNTGGDRPGHDATDRQAILYHQVNDEDRHLVLRGQNASTKNLTDVIEDRHINKTDRPDEAIDYQATTDDRQKLKLTDHSVEAENEDSSDTPKVKTTKITVCLLTFSYSTKMSAYLYTQRGLPPLRKTPLYVIRWQCCPSSRV